ncbi:hypothetical protein G9A89_010735 [Geosiphon pyriformis]|nr:hypothetical protein G9A89_010735 [Geosiphon pyriformis]
MIQALTSTCLKIQVAEPIIFFRGGPQEAVGTVLQGNLVLTLAKPTKIKRIDMKFVGKSKSFWPEGLTQNKSDVQNVKEIVSYKWSYLELPANTNSSLQTIEQLSKKLTTTFSTHENQSRSSLFTSSSSPINGSTTSLNSTTNTISNSSTITTSKYQYFKPGTHTYPFSLFLPGTLPESIDVGLGKVSYKLKATVVRSSALSPNLDSQRQIIIIRTIPDYEFTDSGIAINRDIEDMFAYEISLPKKAYPIGGCINQLEIKLIPLAKQLRVLSIGVQLIEKIMHRAHRQKNCDSRIIAVKRLDDVREQKFAQPTELPAQLPPRRNLSENGGASSTISSANFRDAIFRSGSNSQMTRLHRWNRSFINGIIRGVDWLEEEYTEEYREQKCDRDEMGAGNTYFKKSFDFPIPKCTAPVHPSSNSGSIKVTHSLHFFVIITLPSDHSQRIEVKIEAPIMILSCRCSESVHVTLPKSDDDSYLCPCDPTYKSKATLALAHSLNLNTTTNDCGEVVIDQGISNLSFSASSHRHEQSHQERIGSLGQVWIDGRAIQDPSEWLANQPTSYSYHHNGPPPSYEASIQIPYRSLVEAVNDLSRRQRSDDDDNDSAMKLIENLANQPSSLDLIAKTGSLTPPPTYNIY